MSDRFVLVLAKMPQEGARYAKRVGLRMGRWRAVASASSIRGIQVADLHILPSFSERRDCHAIMGEFRYARDIRKIEVEMPEPEVVDQGDGMGPQLDLLSLLDYDRDAEPEIDLEAEFRAVAKEIADATGSLEAQAMADFGLEDEVVPDRSLLHPEVSQVNEVEKPKKPRRSRCKTCGKMVTGPADPAHDTAAHRGEFF